jgi:hypothetical protein
VRFAHEVHPSEIAYDYWTTQRALEAIGHRPAFGLNWDPSPLRLAGPRPGRLPPGTSADRIYHVDCKDAKRLGDGRNGRLGSHLPWATRAAAGTSSPPATATCPGRTASGCCNSIGYDGPISVEWEDAGMDRLVGAPEAAPPEVLRLRPPDHLLRRRVRHQLSPRQAPVPPQPDALGARLVRNAPPRPPMARLPDLGARGRRCLPGARLCQAGDVVPVWGGVCLGEEARSGAGRGGVNVPFGAGLRAPGVQVGGAADVCLGVRLCQAGDVVPVRGGVCPGEEARSGAGLARGGAPLAWGSGGLPPVSGRGGVGELTPSPRARCACPPGRSPPRLAGGLGAGPRFRSGGVAPCRPAHRAPARRLRPPGPRGLPR